MRYNSGVALHCAQSKQRSTVRQVYFQRHH
jgi:hypothetical protein